MKNKLIKFCTTLFNILLFHNLITRNLINFISLFKKSTVEIEPEHEGRADKTLCFLLGSARSGTTLLSILLSKSEEIFCPPELYLATFDDLKQRRELFRHTLYKSLTLGLVQGMSKLNNKPLSTSMAIIRALEEKELSTVAMYDYLMSQTPCDVFLDKTPSYLSYVSDELFCQRFPEAKYIYVYRHPLAVILSQKKWMDSLSDELFRKQGEKAIENFRKDKIGYLTMALARPDELKEFQSYKSDAFQRYDFDKFKVLESWWRYENQRTLEFLEALPNSQKYIFSFESFVKNPAERLFELLTFLGIDGDAQDLIAAYENKKAPDTVWGILREFLTWEVGDPNQIFMAGRIDSSRADDWQQYAHLWHKLDEETRELALRMGYQVPTFEQAAVYLNSEPKTSS